MTDFSVIPCLHWSGKTPENQWVPDYYPLSWDEVTALLDRAGQLARSLGDGCDDQQRHAIVREISALQCRLVQALPGHVCPHPTEGKVARRQNQLESLYVAGIFSGGTPRLVSAVWAILTESALGW